MLIFTKFMLISSKSLFGTLRVVILGSCGTYKHWDKPNYQSYETDRTT